MSAPQDFFGRAISQYAEDIFADFLAGLFGMLEKGPGLLPEHRIRSMQAAVDRYFNERREARQVIAAEKEANPLTPMVEPWHETPGPDPAVDTYTISADPARGRGIIECRTADGQSATYEVERGGDDEQQNLKWAATMAAQLSLYRGEKSPVVEAPARTPATVFDEAKARLAAEGGQLHVALGNDYPVAMENEAQKKIVLPSVSGSPKEETKPEVKSEEPVVQQDDDAFAGIDEKTFASTVHDEETVEGPEEVQGRAEKQAERSVADAPVPGEHEAPMRDDEEISRQAAGVEAVEQPSQQILEQAMDDSDPSAREAARNTPDVEDIDPQVLDKANADVDAAVHAQAGANAEEEPTEIPEAPAPATQTQDEPVAEVNPPAAVEEPPVVKTEDQQEPPEGEKPEAPESEKPDAATETQETQETPAAEEPHPEEEAPAAELPPEEEAPVVEQSQSEEEAPSSEVPAEEEAPAPVEEQAAPVEDAPVQEAPAEQPAAAVDADPDVVEAGVPTAEPTVEAGMPAPDPSIDVSEQPLPPPAPLPPRQRLTQQIGGVS